MQQMQVKKVKANREFQNVRKSAGGDEKYLTE